MANGLDLGSIIEMFGDLSEVQRQQTQQIAQNQAQQADRAATQASAVREIGELTAGANRKQRMAEMEAVNAARRNATSLGTNAIDASEIITSLHEQMRADALAYQTASKEVQQIEENSNLLSNPLGWMNDLLNGDEARARMEHTAQRHQTTASQLSNMHSLTQQNVQTQLSIAETQDEASINALAKAEMLEAETKALDAEINALTYASTSIDTLRQYGSEEFNRRLQLSSELRQEERFQQSMALQRQQFELQQRKMQMEEAELESWDTTIQKIQTAQRAMNTPEMDAGTIRRVYGQNTPIGESVRELEWMGHVMQNRDQELRIGDTPAESYTRINKFGGNPPPAAAPAMDILDEAASRVQQAVQKVQADPNPAASELGITKDNADDYSTWAAAFNSVATELAQEKNGNRTSTTIPIQNVLKEFPELEQTPFSEKVLKPMLESGTTEAKAPEIFVRAASMYADGKISHNAARDGLAQFFNNSLAMENAYGWLDQVGLPVTAQFRAAVPVGDRPAAPLNTPQYGQGMGPTTQMLQRRNHTTTNRRVIEEVVDLTDPTAISTTLNAFRSRTLADKMRESANQ